MMVRGASISEFESRKQALSTLGGFLGRLFVRNQEPKGVRAAVTLAKKLARG